MYSLAILTFLGSWRPTEWKKGLKLKLYTVYTCAVIFTIYAFMLTIFIDLLKPIENVGDFTNDCFIFLSVIGACTKMTNILGKRHKIIDLIHQLEQGYCLPRNHEEISIKRENNRLIRRNTYLFTGLVEITILAIFVTSLVNDLPHRALPFNAWLPWHVDTLPCYLLAYIHQITANSICATVCAANETFVTGLMIQVCAQIKILRSRLENLPNEIRISKQRENVDDEYVDVESKFFSECIKHHLQIIQFAKSLNEIFNIVIFVQFSIGGIIVCMSLFNLMKLRIMSVEYISVGLYLFAILMQIFIYCWYGNEVIIESIRVGDAAYNMDWTLLNVSTQKDILLIMMRTHRPIKFTSGYIIVLSVELYNTIIKTSYSAYNGLQQSVNR